MSIKFYWNDDGGRGKKEEMRRMKEKFEHDTTDWDEGKIRIEMKSTWLDFLPLFFSLFFIIIIIFISSSIVLIVLATRSIVRVRLNKIWICHNALTRQEMRHAEKKQSNLLHAQLSNQSLNNCWNISFIFLNYVGSCCIFDPFFQGLVKLLCSSHTFYLISMRYLMAILELNLCEWYSMFYLLKFHLCVAHTTHQTSERMRVISAKCIWKFQVSQESRAQSREH